MILNGHVDDTTVAARIDDATGGQSIVSTLMYLPAPPGASFFNPLVLRIEDFFRTKRPPYPVERTQLTGGILDVAPREPHPRPPPDRDSRTCQDRLPGAGRFGVHPQLFDRSRAKSAVK